MCMRIDAERSPLRMAATPETTPSRNSAGTTARSPTVGLSSGCASANTSAWIATAGIGSTTAPQGPQQQAAEEQLLADRRDHRGDEGEHRELGAARLLEVVDDLLVLVREVDEREDHQAADHEQAEPGEHRPPVADVDPQPEVLHRLSGPCCGQGARRARTTPPNWPRAPGRS